jgi:carbamate kinase
VADLIVSGYRVVITHGNGPQVGNLLRRVEAALHILYPLPLYICSADTQGGMGFLLQQFLSNALRQRGIAMTPSTVIAQVLVDKQDPDFANPTKPIGQFFTAEQIRDKIDKSGWTVREDAGRGYRRVVPSPRPLKIIEEPVISRLVAWGFPLITCGGGGVPVIEEDGALKGVDAVIDKDLAASLLARRLNADMLIITTAVEKVALNFKKPGERLLDTMTVPEAKQFLAEGHFAAGSMGPKIEAAVEFTEATGKPTLITLPNRMTEALAGKTGTWIRAAAG